MCIFKSMISLKMLLKLLCEPVCSIQHQSKYWHNSENGIHPFVEWESGHCSQSRTSGVPAGNFHFHSNPLLPLAPIISAGYENAELESWGRSSWEIQAIEGQQGLPVWQSVLPDTRAV